MKIKHLQKNTLIDYPGKIACIIFLFGCNFRCSFCYNPELVLKEESKDLDKEEILSFLDKRKGVLDGVCITGGEPLLDLDRNFLRKIKEKGFLIKLDTNGGFPEKLKEFIEEGLLNYIAMDIKAPLNEKDYLKVTNTKININKIKESINLILKSGIDYEFRTTLIPSIHTKENIKEIVSYIKNAKKYVLQEFKNNVKTLDPEFQKFKPFSLNELKEFLEVSQKINPNTKLRAKV